MAKTIKIASVQMDANPAPLAERLERAERLITQAVQAEAQLVVLPELFNTGYTYADTNYHLAEPIDGTTRTWIQETAAKLGIYLAGSLMILEQSDIYNSLLLFSPTGQMWRYDKNYPWAWERGYFRERRNITIAQTELGDMGMLICWDIGHPHLWKQYAGQVDMMLITSCPPDGPDANYHFPDGSKISLSDLGSWMASLKDSGHRAFGEMVNQQTAWLGVPSVNTGGSGHIRTHIPAGNVLVRVLALAMPRLIRKFSQAHQMQMACGMVPSCKIVGANGQILAERTPAEGEGFTIAEVALADTKPAPHGRQPPTLLKRMAYLQADTLIPFLMRPIYRRGVQQILKERHKPA